MDPLSLKVLILFGALAVAFIAFVQALNMIGRFTILIGADPKIMERGEGDAVGYLTALFIDALRTYRVGIHFLSALIPVLFWLFDPYLCIAVTLALFAKFIFFDDFVYLTRKRRRPLRPRHLKP